MLACLRTLGTGGVKAEPCGRPERPALTPPFGVGDMARTVHRHRLTAGFGTDSV